jgi:hypothetical protein
VFLIVSAYCRLSSSWSTYQQAFRNAVLTFWPALAPEYVYLSGLQQLVVQGRERSPQEDYLINAVTLEKGLSTDKWPERAISL